MSNVTVVGLGEMGSALAAALLSGGSSVTVWNRSAARATPLRRRGARFAGSVDEALAASPILLICVSDYPATSTILDAPGVEQSLAGKLVVQLTSGVPKQARALDKRISAAGARYLDGAIAAWPRQIGTSTAGIVISGPQPAYTEVETTLKLLAGNLSYVGEEIGAALALFNSALSYLAGHWIGFGHGAAL